LIRRSVISALLLAALQAICVTPCVAYPVTVKDARGKSVVIRSAPRRIVSLTPNNTEILFALGLGDRVVGVNSWSNYPPAALKKAKVGDRIISVEKVVSLKPDLIVAHAVLNDSYIKQLETLHKTVIAIDPKTYGQVMSDITMLGRATGQTKQAAAIVKRMCAAVDKVRKRTAGRRGPNVLVEIQPNPLWAAGPGTLVDEMLGYCHARNVAFDSKSGFNEYPVELAVSHKPDVIIAGKREGKFFLTSPLWRNATAVRNKRVYEMDFDLLVRPGPRLADGLLRLSEVLR
jgi:iron complex transport system substrate-binding protein